MTRTLYLVPYVHPSDDLTDFFPKTGITYEKIYEQMLEQLDNIFDLFKDKHIDIVFREAFSKPRGIDSFKPEKLDRWNLKFYEFVALS